MSYILDALRKAERERGMHQMPTLMTEHAPRNPNRNRLRIGLVIAFVSIAAIVGWYLAQERLSGIAEPKSGVEYASPDSGADTGAAKAPTAKSDTSMASPAAITPSEKPVSSAVAPGVATTIAPRNADGGQAIPRRPQANLPDNEEIDPQLTGKMARSNVASTDPSIAVNQPASFREVVGKMTLSLLMYSDSKEECMVYINGNKYREGEYVEGSYLIERITEDGAILSFQGERALLQPKSK